MKRRYALAAALKKSEPPFFIKNNFFDLPIDI